MWGRVGTGMDALKKWMAGTPFFERLYPAMMF
jgi:hypothetical protein